MTTAVVATLVSSVLSIALAALLEWFRRSNMGQRIAGRVRSNLEDLGLEFPGPGLRRVLRALAQARASTSHVLAPRGEPATRLDAIVRFLFRKKTYETSFEPLFDDLFNEHKELLDEGRTAKARWLRLTAWWYYLSALVTLLSTSLLGKVIKLIKG